MWSGRLYQGFAGTYSLHFHGEKNALKMEAEGSTETYVTRRYLYEDSKQ
jgi:hypothetical protein